MKKIIYVYINSEYGEPEIFTSKDAAVEEAINDLTEHAKHWEYSDSELEDAIADVKNGAERDVKYFGSYIGELNTDIYEREIEI